jgi:NAD(P)-dependent dehydrogenase (short-subunit alcohol dehydrogenase family)
MPGDASRAGYVLITGCSTGIGPATAVHLARRGLSVIATARTPLNPSLGSAVHTLELDVTNAASIDRAAERVQAIVGSDGLRGLVNNAGICVAGPVEALSIDDWRRQFEVNLFGPLAVTKAMLPLLRVHRRKHGRHSARIVMVSSIAGRVSQPIAGAYCASKHALEAASDALRNELKPAGIDISLVEPGVFDTQLWRKAIDQMCAAAAEPLPDEDYAWQINAVCDLARGLSGKARPAEGVAKVIADCLLRPRAPVRVLVGADAKLFARAKAWLPTRLFDSTQRWAIERKRDQLAAQAATLRAELPPP